MSLSSPGVPLEGYSLEQDPDRALQPNAIWDGSEEFWSETLQLGFRAVKRRDVTVPVFRDPQTGLDVLTRDSLDLAMRKGEERAQREAQLRQQAEDRAQQAEDGRLAEARQRLQAEERAQQAEVRAQREAQLRQQAEEQVQELLARLANLEH